MKVKKLIILIMMSFMLTGCSLAKAIIAPFKPTQNTLPQQIEQSKNKVICKGEYKLDENGTVIYCSKGYFGYESNYEKKERKMTIVEKIKNYINNLMGYAFWIFLALVILCPSALGFIGGRIIEGIFGIGKKALDATVRGVQDARKKGIPLDTALGIKQDDDVKLYIAKLKEDEKIK